MSLKKWYSIKTTTHGEGEDDEIEKLFELLEEGEEKIVLDENHKNPIFALGNTGSGKSTVIQFIATDNKALHSQETYPGSDEYIIVDDNETIGGGVTSQTLFPALVVDEDIQAAYYDCPGFNDTRSASNEIASSYFIKKVFDFAEELKIILTVNHSSVRPGVERRDFMDLLKHSTTLIKDIQKYAGCIALFVTKVENTYKKDPVEGIILVPDETVINNVANYLESVKKEIEEKLPKRARAKASEDEFHRSAIKLINTFLTKDSAGKFTRIAIFRRPDEAGPILDVELLQERKPAMKEVIYEAIQFVKKDSDDFGHTISDSAKLHVNKMVDRLRKNVSTEIDNVVGKLKTYDQEIGEQIENIIASLSENSATFVNEDVGKELSSKLNASFDAITKLESDVVLAKTFKEIATAIEVCGSTLKIDTEAAVINLMRQDNYFEFLQTTNGGLTIGEYSKNFDGILVSLASTRKDIEKDADYMANSVRERTTKILNDTIKELNRCYDEKFNLLGIKELATEFEKQHKILLESVEEMKKLNDAQELSNEITTMATKSEIASAEMSSCTMAVFNYGNYLTFLHIMNQKISVWSPEWIKTFEGHAESVLKTQKWYNFLQRLYTKVSSYAYLEFSERYNVANVDDWGLPNKPQGIQITKANYKKFLEKINEDDEHVKNMELDETKLKELNRVLELTVKQKISTEMKSTGELVIQAVFVKFSDFLYSNGTLKPEVTDGKQVNMLHIFATDTVFVDRDLNAVGQRLQVNVVAPNWEVIGTRSVNLNGNPGESLGKAENGSEPGGKGKDGQPGLPGSPGGNFVGIGYEFKEIEKLTVTADGGRGAKGQEGGNGGNGKNGLDGRKESGFESKLVSLEGTMVVVSKYIFYGKDGTPGGNAGNGGVGGVGAAAGKIKIMRTDMASALPTTQNQKGSNGDGNNGGSGGQGGKRGDDIHRWKIDTIASSKWTDAVETLPRTERSPNGSNGAGNSNDSKIKQPEKAADLISIGEVLNGFEFYLRELVHDRFLKETLTRFLDSLHIDKRIYTNHVYGTMSLAGNLSNLERQLIKLNDSLTNDEIIYLYQSIIDRTTEYINNPQPDEDTKEYKKALKYIQTAALCQIQFRKDSFAPNLIIDVTRYLDNVLRDVKILKDLNDKNNKVKVVNEAKEKFKDTIDKKIEEALSFIENEILPEIENVNEELGQQMDKLVEEVVELQEEAEKEKQELERKKRQLQRSLNFFMIFAPVKMALLFLGPVGQIGGLGIDILENLANKKSTRSLRAADVESIKSQIKEVKEEIGKAKAKTPDFSKIIAEIKKRYSGDKEKLSAIDEAIAEAEERLKALQEYEKLIYDTMVPMLDDVEQMLDEVSAQLESQSQVSLDVTKWKVQSALRDVKSQMQQMTRGFSVEDDVVRCIEKLEEAMTAQINIYDRIQSYQEQKNLADYMAVVSTGVDESNPALSATLRTLEVMIRSNLVLDQHKQAVNAVTQNVFPFAHLYLKEIFLFHRGRSDTTLDDVVEEAVKQLNAMKKNIEKYKTSIGKQDEYITSSEFNSEYVISKPFYVWKNEKKVGIISKLLEGKKVILYTDVRRANTDKFAIKFNLSEINFKAPNKEIQADINEKLKKFKVNMTHLGTSYYRFDRRVYIIHCESQSIQYSFERKHDSDLPVEFNGVYEKIKNGDLMLSPFAMWEIQLTNLINDGDFKDLEKFKDQVDLEFVGSGNFVTPNLDVGTLYVENYYKSDPSMVANVK